MASKLPRAPQGRPWQARRKREGYSYFIGYFATKEEAEAEEAEFDKDWPPYGGRACTFHASRHRKCTCKDDNETATNQR